MGFFGVEYETHLIRFDFMKYFWEIGSIDIEPPQIRNDESKYQLSIFGEEEIRFIKNNIIGIAHKDLMNDLKSGDTCLGIKNDGEISVYSFIKHQNSSIRGREFVIKPSES